MEASRDINLSNITSKRLKSSSPGDVSLYGLTQSDNSCLPILKYYPALELTKDIFDLSNFNGTTSVLTHTGRDRFVPSLSLLAPSYLCNHSPASPLSFGCSSADNFVSTYIPDKHISYPVSVSALTFGGSAPNGSSSWPGRTSHILNSQWTQLPQCVHQFRQLDNVPSLLDNVPLPILRSDFKLGPGLDRSAQYISNQNQCYVPITDPLNLPAKSTDKSASRITSATLTYNMDLLNQCKMDESTVPSSSARDARTIQNIGALNQISSESIIIPTQMQSQMQSQASHTTTNALPSSIQNQSGIPLFSIFQTTSKKDSTNESSEMLDFGRLLSDTCGGVDGKSDSSTKIHGEFSGSAIKERQRADRNAREQRRSALLAEQVESLRVTLEESGVRTSLGRHAILNEVAEYISSIKQQINDIEIEMSSNIESDLSHEITSGSNLTKIIIPNKATISNTDSIITRHDKLFQCNGTMTSEANVVMSSNTYTNERWQNQHDSMRTAVVPFHQVFKYAALPVAVTDLWGRFLHCSSQFEKETGYNQSDLLQRTLFSIIVSTEMPKLSKLMMYISASFRLAGKSSIIDGNSRTIEGSRIFSSPTEFKLELLSSTGSRLISTFVVMLDRNGLPSQIQCILCKT